MAVGGADGWGVLLLVIGGRVPESGGAVRWWEPAAADGAG
jgi:hypothetical protein